MNPAATCSQVPGIHEPRLVSFIMATETRLPALSAPTLSVTNNRWLPAVALLAITWLAYIPAMRAGFVWDDDNYVTQNRVLRNVSGLISIWTDPQSTPQYYPIVHSTFWIEYQIWGLHPAGYHLVNILLHGANAILLWQILRKLSLPAPWFAAAIFALHPVHVESVAWITERKNMLSGLFYLAAALAYLQFAFPAESNPNPPRNRWRYYALSLICFVAALLSKTVTVTLPAALLLIVWWRRGRLISRDALPLLPMFCIGIPFGLLTIWLERNHVGAVGADWQFSFMERCLIAGRALGFYATKLAWPSPLIFIYPRWQISTAVWWQGFYPIAVIAVVAFLARRRRLTGPLLAVLLFAGTLFPALGFFNVFPMRYSFVADHFQYLASIPLIVLAVSAGHSLIARFQLQESLSGRGAALVLLLLLAGLTWRQAGIYKDRETLWRDTITKNPACSMAHNNLGLVLSEQGRLTEASVEFRRVLQLEPKDTHARLNLANLRSEQGRLDEAVEQYELLLKIDPANVLAHFNLGNALDSLQRPADAEVHYRKALELDPNNVQARVNLATLLIQQKHWDEAQRELLESLRIAPDFYLAHCNLAALYEQTGQHDQALRHAREGLRLAPDSPQAQQMLKHIEGKQ